MKSLAARIAIPVVAVLAMVGLDQWTKQLAETQLRPVGLVRLVPGFAELIYSRNRGAFFSFGETVPLDLRRPLFAVATVVAIVFLVRMYVRAAEGATQLRVAVVLVCAGALGNLIDRLRSGEVVDFLHVHAAELFHWATFNVADVYITVGVVMLVADGLRRRPKSAPSPRAEAA